MTLLPMDKTPTAAEAWCMSHEHRRRLDICRPSHPTALTDPLR